MPEGLRWVVISVVTIVWAASVVADFISKEYDPGGEIHGVFTGIVGIALASPGRKADRDG